MESLIDQYKVYELIRFLVQEFGSIFLCIADILHRSLWAKSKDADINPPMWDSYLGVKTVPLQTKMTSNYNNEIQEQAIKDCDSYKMDRTLGVPAENQ